MSARTRAHTHTHTHTIFLLSVEAGQDLVEGELLLNPVTVTTSRIPHT